MAFNNHTLYYLNRLQIIPWIKKERTVPRDTKGAPLIILISKELNEKVRALLNQILHYITLSPDDVLITTDFETLSKNNPKAVLSLGVSLAHLNLPYPVFRGAALEHLLENPLSKKEIFPVLTQLKFHLHHELCLKTFK